ncbi:MAG: PIG-L family deacetylase [Bacteroidetes bacterium]|nr:PIG-L family deacetylase [Bacteroidota bacterium]
MLGYKTYSRPSFSKGRWLFICWLGCWACGSALAQAPRPMTSSEIAHRLRQLNVLGSVLYVAAHPDDENTRLLAYLARDRQYRAGYLSMTRGDGGQNLIGDEQGVELGIIRTQELLAARRIDGAEQFFTRAFDFGFCKSTEEALQTWGHEKILADVVWVIRRFQPDVIVTRFPEDARAGHGHHSASGVLAREAFLAAADPKRFPEQFQHGVKPWQAKRLLWNTFNFGGANTTAENQFRLDVGGFLPLLGRSLGEISAESRSQHRSQGFGSASSRGSQTEYFIPVLGEVPANDLLDGVNTGWQRLEGGAAIAAQVEALVRGFSYTDPSASVAGLVRLYQAIEALPPSVWRDQKLKEASELLEAAAGMHLEAATAEPYAVRDDSLSLTLTAILRSGIRARWDKASLEGLNTSIARPLPNNRPISLPLRIHVSPEKPLSQPYWLVEEMDKGSFQVSDPSLIGKAEGPPAYTVRFDIEVEGTSIRFEKPLLYKSTDPVKGELFQPLFVVPSVSVNTSPGVMLFRKGEKRVRDFTLTATAYTRIPTTKAHLEYRYGSHASSVTDTAFRLNRGQSRDYPLAVSNQAMGDRMKDRLFAGIAFQQAHTGKDKGLALAQIQYDHIPTVRYFYPDGLTVLNIPVATAGRRIGYVRGAGDKVPEALLELGFEVTYLGEDDMDIRRLQGYDAVVTGIRAYNVHEWLNARHEVLMEYVRGGGNLVVQYNTNSFSGPIRSRIGPFDFSISRNRTTDEQAAVTFLAPEHPVLQWPNRITAADFDGWVQERGIYFAAMPIKGYTAVLGMRDPGEGSDQMGSLVVAPYGKGRFIYTGLVFFRQLPAGVPGAYRLMANLVSNPNVAGNGEKK